MRNILDSTARIQNIFDQFLHSTAGNILWFGLRIALYVPVSVGVRRCATGEKVRVRQLSASEFPVGASLQWMLVFSRSEFSVRGSLQWEAVFSRSQSLVG
jgi:hypothetical protein